MRFSVNMLICGVSFVLLFSMSAVSDAQGSRKHFKTLNENGYRIELFYYPLEEYGDDYGCQYEIYFDDILALKTKRWPFMDIYNFRFDPQGRAKPCHFRDITGDSTTEVIFICYSGGNNAAEDVYVYSMDSIGTLIAGFENLDKGPWFPKDIDNDNIPEMIFRSQHYLCWRYGCSGSPAPYLVWKWNGFEYKLANLKLSDEILRILYGINCDDFISAYLSDSSTVISAPYPWKEDYGYPVELLRKMLWLIYSGRKDLADRMFNHHWPDDIPGKGEFYNDLMNRVKSDSFFPKVENSNW